ncbi:hypothetical protein SAMD00019534_074600 [Acytostelium subglobosum LB1]|uniref:hypothetical protein n=1 Tax=Acytostelium subglobosum LB1 TaxID=1410327 RepID=UPI000644F681|nr:hypothetical protein SAMD00019534_074600 [Acytostelium subglobosum LB1]GAM24285.1 hypothetical protein SAMD00019534_074600 [Acytostelium subglobosum LB1]|eukprot:XP_012752611.1 hypothetical protein SAMD00019534_074600 [Acytostelium subglobosum LB1]
MLTLPPLIFYHTQLVHPHQQPQQQQQQQQPQPHPQDAIKKHYKHLAIAYKHQDISKKVFMEHLTIIFGNNAEKYFNMIHNDEDILNSPRPPPGFTQTLLESTPKIRGLVEQILYQQQQQKQQQQPQPKGQQQQQQQPKKLQMTQHNVEQQQHHQDHYQTEAFRSLAIQRNRHQQQHTLLKSIKSPITNFIFSSDTFDRQYFKDDPKCCHKWFKDLADVLEHFPHQQTAPSPGFYHCTISKRQFSDLNTCQHPTPRTNTMTGCSLTKMLPQ